MYNNKLQPIVDAALEQILTHHPEHNFRAQRAAYLLHKKHIFKVAGGYECISSSSTEKYVIERNAQTALWECTCKDFEFNAPILTDTEQKACKHILAAMMLHKTKSAKRIIRDLKDCKTEEDFQEYQNLFCDCGERIPCHKVCERRWER